MIIRNLTDISLQRPTVLTLGTFDGVHLGHQALLDRVMCIAVEQGLTPSVLTFPEPPQNHVNGQPRKRLILPATMKYAMLETFGIEIVVVTQFHEIAGLSPQEFARQILREQLNVHHMVVGYDCRFGKNRSGDSEILRALGREYGFLVSVLDPVVVDDVIVSSTEVRKAIQAGDVERATRLLGYPFPFQVGPSTQREPLEMAIGNTSRPFQPDALISEGGFVTVQRRASRSFTVGAGQRGHD